MIIDSQCNITLVLTIRNHAIYIIEPDKKHCLIEFGDLALLLLVTIDTYRVETRVLYTFLHVLQINIYITILVFQICRHVQ